MYLNQSKANILLIVNATDFTLILQWKEMLLKSCASKGAESHSFLVRQDCGEKISVALGCLRRFILYKICIAFYTQINYTGLATAS